MHISHCPRCGCSALENLPTHAYCLECSYSPEVDPGLRMWRHIEFPRERSQKKSRMWLRDHPLSQLGHRT